MSYKNILFPTTALPSSVLRKEVLIPAPAGLVTLITAGLSFDGYAYAKLTNLYCVEIVKIIGVLGGMLFVQRGQLGTEALDFPVGTYIQHTLSIDQFTEIVTPLVIETEGAIGNYGTYLKIPELNIVGLGAAKAITSTLYVEYKGCCYGESAPIPLPNIEEVRIINTGEVRIIDNGEIRVCR